MTVYKMGKGGPSWNGIPMYSSRIPVTFGNTANEGAGRAYFVNPTTGSDGNKGRSMDKPFASIDKFMSVQSAESRSNNHDICVLSATSAHAQTEEITLTNSRTHFFGLDAVGRYMGQRTRVTMGVTTVAGTIAVLQNTGVGNTFENIKFDSGDTLATSLYAFADGGEYTVINNCEFYKSTDLDQTTSAVFLCNADSPLYQGCSFGSLATAVSVNRPNMKMNRETITGKVARDVRIDDCQFLINTSSTDAAHIHGTGATDIERMMIINDTLFINAVLGSADPDECVEFDSAQTQGYVLITGKSGEVGHSALSTTTGVFLLNAGDATNSGMSAIQSA